MQSSGEAGSGDDEATRRLDTTVDDGGPERGADELVPGSMVGRYRIERRIGAGGMGAVYRAEQLEPVRRTVALKLLRGRLSTRQRAYFEIERQTLAQMHHPAIAQIFDAGTTHDGVPWFAMEYIEGRPITEVCRTMALDDRLALMARVCEAIQHAHQKGVVHRDLKPANILVSQVDGRWLPKIIDFGIATAAARTAVADDGDTGGPVDRAGTLEYMSPEQLQGRLAAIDTRSDVYALGVVLFELIAGDRPSVASQSGRTASPTRGAPTLPSQHVRATRKGPSSTGRIQNRRLRELDQIVLTAMAHDRNDRYPSASALADELRRFLGHQPLSAMPASPGYLLGKFARRNRLLLASAATVLVVLVGGLVLSLHAFSQARAQREVAQARQKDLEQVVAFQQAMLSGIDVMAMGGRLLDLEREQLARVGDPSLLQHFDRVVAKLDGPSLARSILVESVLKRAEMALDQRFAEEPLLAADLRHAVGEVYHAIGQYDDAVEAFRAVLAQREAGLGETAAPTVAAQVALANALERLGRFVEAQQVADTALARSGGLADNDPLQVALRMVLAQIARSKVEHHAARTWHEQGVAAALRAYPPDHPEVMRVRQQYALSLHLDGATEQARPQFEQVLAAQRQRPEDWQPLVGTLVNYAAMLADSGDSAAALKLEREAYAIQRERSGADHPLTLMILNNIGMSMLDSGADLDEALAALDEAVDGRVRVLGPEHPLALRSMASKARALAQAERTEEALAAYRHVYQVRERILGAGNRDTIRVGRSLGDLLDRIGQDAEALALARELHGRVVENEGEFAGEAIALTIEIARLLGETGQPAAGERVLREQLDALVGADRGDDPATWRVALALYRQYRDGQRIPEAEALRRQVLQAVLERDESQLDPRLRALQREIADALSVEDAAG